MEPMRLKDPTNVEEVRRNLCVIAGEVRTRGNPHRSAVLDAAHSHLMRLQIQRDGLTEALDKLLALYRKETGQVSNPIVVEAERWLNYESSAVPPPPSCDQLKADNANQTA